MPEELIDRLRKTAQCIPIATDSVVAEDVSKTCREAAARIEELEKALLKAAVQFEFYVKDHRAKAGANGFNGLLYAESIALEKMQTNQWYADMCRKALGEKGTVSV